MSRSLGWTLLTTRSPIEMVPEVMFSRPASIRNSVDLPQPEGPTSTTNSPSSIGIDTPCKTSKLPNDFRTWRICTDDILTPLNFCFVAPQTCGDALLSFRPNDGSRIQPVIIICSFAVFSNPMVALSIIVQTSNPL